jgi:hypothetical protein
VETETAIDGAALRATVRRLRTETAIGAVPFCAVLGIEAVLHFAEGGRGIAAVFAGLCTLLSWATVFNLSRGHKRDAIVCAGSDAGVRVFVASRLSRKVAALRRTRTVVSSFVVAAIAAPAGVLALITGHERFALRAAGLVLFGAYFAGGTIWNLLVAAPGLERKLAAVGPAPADAARDPALGEMALAIRAREGIVPAALFWGEVTGQRLGTAKVSVEALRGARPEPPPTW